MKKTLGRILRIGAIVAGVLALLIVAAVLLVLFDKPLVRNLLRTQLAKSTGMTIRFGALDYSLLPFRLTVDALELGQEDAFQKRGVSMARLEAKGDFWKLARGIKPALETVEIEGLDFRLEEKVVSEEPLDLEAILAQVTDTLAWGKRVSVRNARLSFLFISREISLEDLDLFLTTGAEGGGIAYSIGRCHIGVKDKGGAFALMTGLSSSGTLRLVSPFAIDAVLHFDSPRLAAAGAGIEQSLAGLTIEAAAKFDRSASELAVSRMKIGVPGLLDLDGTAAGRFGYSLYLEVEATARFDKLENLAALLAPRLPVEFRAAKLRGRAGLSGKYSLHRSSRETTDDLTGSLSLEGVEFEHVLGGIPLRVGASGRLDASGPTADLRLAADVRASFGRIAWAGLAVASSDARVIATVGKSGADITRLDARLSGLVLGAAGGKRISFDNVALTGKGSLDLVRKNAVLTSLEARLPGLAPLLMTGRLGLGPKGASQVRVECHGLDIAALRGLASPFIPASLAGWDLGGAADLSLEARRPASPGESWGFSAGLALTGAKFNDPSFTIAGEGLAPVLKVEGTFAASQGISFAGALALDRGESLWKAVYVSWSKHPLKATIAGRYDPGSGAVDDLAARFFFPTIGEVNLNGSVQTRPLPGFELRTDARLSLGPLYSLYTQAGVAAADRMRLEGRIEAGLLVRKAAGGLSVGGRLKLADAALELPASKTLLVGVSADLPVLVQTGLSRPGAPETALPDQGFFRIGEFQSPFLTLKPVAVALRAGPNALAIEPLTLELFGGRFELGRTTFRFDPQSGSLRGIGSLALSEIDIARFPISSPQFKLTGKVRAEFPRLDISAKEIAISGRGEADVFGGKVVLRDLAVSDPFTAGRSISLNIDLVDLDLKKLTDEVPFGEVTGIVRGEIRGLVISYGQPARFDLRIESVPRQGVAQTFSLKAVDNLTVLSSGERASGGTSQFWMRFIRGFRYQHLGIVSTLRNDTFTLNGTIHEGGVEYLVKKPALFGISVVNRMPEKVISFKEMTGRLKRVGQSDK